MPSEKLASAENLLKGNLASAWNILEGSSGDYTDLGIARRFGGASAAYSLRDIGAMNGRVVKVRRDSDDEEEDFSASQVSSGALEDWVNGKFEDTLPVDVDDANAEAAYSLRKVKSNYIGYAVRIRRSSDDIEVDVAFDSDDKVSASSAITNVAEQGGESGQTTATTLGDFISGTDAFVHTWYDQAGSNDATQATDANQPQIAENGALFTKRGQTTLKFRGTDSVPIFLEASASITASHSVFIVGQPSPDGATDLDGNDVKNNTFWSAGNNGVSLHIAGLNSAFSEGYRNSGDASRIFSYTATQEFHTSVNLHTAINGSSNFSYYANTVSKISDLNGTVTDTAITIGKKGTDISGFQPHNTRGFISELIQYNSDQTDNRFKIESNINNYYGLYTFQGDGFVETWYDQSGNGNNATQASDSNQPTIISSGSQVTLDNGTPSVAFSRPDGFASIRNLSISSPIANEPYTFFATTVHNSSSTWFRLFGESNAPPEVLLRKANTIEFNPSDSDASGALSATTTSDNIVSGFSGVNGGADGILRFNGANLKTDISRTEDGDSITIVGRFPNDGTNFAHIESLVIYESDLSADFDTIEKELAQPINIL